MEIPQIFCGGILAVRLFHTGTAVSRLIHKETAVHGQELLGEAFQHCRRKGSYAVGRNGISLRGYRILQNLCGKFPRQCTSFPLLKGTVKKISASR